MSGGSLFDEDLIRRIPLPLAQLYRRADNAVEPLKRHLAAFDLWEAALILLASTAIVEYVEQPEIDPQIAEKLKNLARPHLGQWWEFVRLLIPALALRGDEHFRQLETLLLGPTRDDVPRAAGLDAAVLEVLGKKGRGAQASVRLRDLFDHLVTYRNKLLAHAAPGNLRDDLNERMARVLLAGLSQLLGRVDFLAGRRLLYVASVRPEAGRWVIDRFELKGESARHLEPLEIPRTAKDHMPVDGKRLYLEAPGAAQALGSTGDLARMRLLHPLVTYEPHGEQIFFLSGRPTEKRSDYLCYMTGRHDERTDVGSEQRELLARVLRMPVDDAQLHQWADRPADDAQSEPERPAPATGPRTVGEFQLLAKLGEGGMGVVYRAWQPSLRRQVALKVLSGMGEKAEARFNREIQALGRVDHPHIVKVFTSGSDGEFWFYAMELVEGVPLSMICDQLESQTTGAGQVDLQTWHGALSTACAESRRSEKPLSNPPSPPLAVPNVAREAAPSRPALGGGRDYARQIAHLTVQVAQGAHALHEANVIHRDIKPGNIMVAANGTQAVLVDLGVAQLADDIDGKLTRTRQVVGTLRYASPQQVLAVGKLDRRTDVYSLGVTMWELLTLRPFLGANDDMPEPVLMEKIQHEEPQRIRAFHPRIPRDLEAIVQKCLEKDPKRRYATADDLAADLTRFLNGETVIARPVGMLRRGYRRVKRRPVRALAVAAAFAALIAGAFGYAYWDAHLRTKVDYFATFIMKRGAPVGVGRVDEAQSRQRRVTWKFTRRGDRVDKIEALNGYGYPTTEHGHGAFIKRSDETTRESAYRYRHDAEGNVEEEIALDRADQVVWTFHFSTPTTGYYADKRGFPRARGGSGAAFVEFVYNEAGFEQEARYLDKDGKPQASAEGVFGNRREYDERGLEVSRTFLDADGNMTLYKSGYARWTAQYNAFGNQTEHAYFGLDGKPVATKDGIAESRCLFDERGNEIEVAYFGADGKPTLHKDGNAKITREFDEHGNATAGTYVGLDGKSVAIKSGYAKWTSKYDERGNEIETAYFSVNGDPAIREDGNARRTARFDDRGNEIARVFLDPAGKPVAIKYGYAQWTAAYDDHGNQIEKAYFGADGKAALHAEGYSKWTASFDDRENQTTLAYFGVDGIPTIHKDGYSRWMKKYDDRGNGIETAYFGVDGKPTLHKVGYAVETARFDDRGNRIELVALGLDGKPVSTSIGLARVVIAYDNRGNPIEKTVFGPDGRPTAARNGYAKTVAKYDDRGNNLDTTYFGVDGQPVVNKDGYAEWTRKYDDHGNEVGNAFFGLGGKPVVIKEGYAIRIDRFDDRGNPLVEEYFGVDGKPTVNKDGYSKKSARFDDRGNIVERAYFGLHEEPVLSKDGYARIKSKYDERSNEIESEVFGRDGKPIAAKWGYAKVLSRYDDRGNQIEAAFFRIDGQPALETEGEAKWTAKYDDRCNQIERAYFGLDGKPCAIKAGFAKTVRKWDDRGNEVATAYFAPDGAPARNQLGYTRVTKAYDPRGVLIAETRFGLNGTRGYTVLSRAYDASGNLIEEACFDETGKAVLEKDEYHKAIAKYDDHGNGVELAYFGIDGKPALHKDGYAKWTAKFDDRGNKTQLEFFGVDGTPALQKGAYCKITARHDLRGHLIEHAYFGLDGELVRGPAGYSKATLVFDDKGNRIAAAWWGSKGEPVDSRRFDAGGRITEESYSNGDGKPVAGAEGFAKACTQFDDRGNVIERAYFGVDGKPVLHRDGNAKVVRKFDRRGNMVEEAFFGLDAKPVSINDGYARRTAVYDEKGTPVKKSYFDASDKPITVRVVTDEILPATQGLKLGIKPGDELRIYDGEAVTDMASFIDRRQRERPTDKPRELQLLRNGSTIKVSVSPGRLGIVLRDQVSAAAQHPAGDATKKGIRAKGILDRSRG